MREIKFRAFNILAGVMIPISKISLPNIACGDDSPYLMQYTGLKDKNGKEIYEGDIILFDNQYKHEIKFINGMFIAGHIMMIEHLRMEVIGNIYENPEMLQ